MSNNVDTAKWFNAISKSPREAEEEYDRISGSYDSDLKNKGYKAPKDAAQILASSIPPNGEPILDAGCGTGLVGLYLKNQGFTKITGVDISANCLGEAKKKGAYACTLKHNLLEPFPFGDASFVGVTCIGVCSRFDDSQILTLVKEFARLTKEKGVILVSHREDLMKSSKIIRDIEKDSAMCLQLEAVTEPYPYISIDENYKNIGVQYIILRKYQ